MAYSWKSTITDNKGNTTIYKVYRFTSACSFQVDRGVVVTIATIGGGGGGGNGAGGGGSGGQVVLTTTTLSSDSTYSITQIGTAGTGATSSTTAGIDGGNTIINLGGTETTAAGGKGGASNKGSGGASGSNSSTGGSYKGGTSSQGTYGCGGGGGGSSTSGGSGADLDIFVDKSNILSYKYTYYITGKATGGDGTKFVYNDMTYGVGGGGGLYVSSIDKWSGCTKSVAGSSISSAGDGGTWSTAGMSPSGTLYGCGGGGGGMTDSASYNGGNGAKGVVLVAVPQ